MNKITDEVISGLGGDDARLKLVMAAAVRHLHAFVAEVGLERDEMEATLRFLDAVSAANSDSHNEGVLLADVLGVSSLICDQSQREDMALLGPFWRINSPEVEYGGSIIRGQSPGLPLQVSGQVSDPAAAADIDALEAWVGFRPSTPVRAGVQRFVDWYLRYHGLAAPRTNDPVNRP